MGHVTTVYGVIEVNRSPEAKARTDAALAVLPDKDAWPFLVRSMFSLTASEHVTVDYRARALHFGASMKELEWDWPEWLGKFERFLSQVDGDRAVVHLRGELVGNHDCEWLRRHGSADNWPPVWEFERGPRAF